MPVCEKNLPCRHNLELIFTDPIFDFNLIINQELTHIFVALF